MNPEDKTFAEWDKVWGQPQVTKETIQTLKAKGFNVLRLPVTWYPHIAKFSKTYTKDEDYAIDAAWMARVKEIVKMINDEGMYCIVNIQHDAGANNGSGDPNSAWLHADNDYENVTKIYQAIWKQIATEMKDFDDKVIFESFNEILNAKSSWTAPAAGVLHSIAMILSGSVTETAIKRVKVLLTRRRLMKTRSITSMISVMTRRLKSRLSSIV